MVFWTDSCIVGWIKLMLLELKKLEECWRKGPLNIRGASKRDRRGGNCADNDRDAFHDATPEALA